MTSAEFKRRHGATALAMVRGQNPGISDADAEAAADDILVEWEYDRACECSENGYPEDTLTVAHCDDWGTGEGRFHGRM